MVKPERSCGAPGRARARRRCAWRRPPSPSVPPRRTVHPVPLCPLDEGGRLECRCSSWLGLGQGWAGLRLAQGSRSDPSGAVGIGIFRGAEVRFEFPMAVRCRSSGLSEPPGPSTPIPSGPSRACIARNSPRKSRNWFQVGMPWGTNPSSFAAGLGVDHPAADLLPGVASDGDEVGAARDSRTRGFRAQREGANRRRAALYPPGTMRASRSEERDGHHGGTRYLR